MSDVYSVHAVPAKPSAVVLAPHLRHPCCAGHHTQADAHKHDAALDHVEHIEAGQEPVLSILQQRTNRGMLSEVLCAGWMAWWLSCWQ